MVTIPTGIAVNVSDTTKRTTASGFRAVFGALFKQSAPGVPVAGILPAPGTPLNVATSSSMKYVVSAGFALTTRQGQGAYVVGSVVPVTVTVPAADATNPRYDRIYIVQPDPELSETGDARIDAAVGTPSASPSLPSIPTGALELGRKLVPAGASGTSTGTAITNAAPFTTLNATVGIADVTGLQAALDSKQSGTATIPYSRLTNIPGGLAALANGTIANTNLPTRLQEIAPLVTGSWDSYVLTGWYRGDNLINSPVLGTGDNWYFVEVIAHDSKYVNQQATGYTGSGAMRVFNRQLQSGTWTGWTELQSDATRLSNGGHTLTLGKDGSLSLDGTAFKNSSIFASRFSWNVDSTGRIFGSDTAGTNIPVYTRMYSADGAGGATGVRMSPSSNRGSVRLAVVTNSGTLGSWTGRMVRTYLPFELDSGATTVAVNAVSGHTGWYSGTKTVTFNNARISGVPDITLGVHTGQNNGTVYAGLTSADSNSFSLTVTREQNADTAVTWIAANQFSGLEDVT